MSTRPWKKNIAERQAAQEALADLNARAGEQSRRPDPRSAGTQRDPGRGSRPNGRPPQEALLTLNTSLEDNVRERTNELQELNATLEEEIVERHAAQEMLRETNTELKAFVNALAHDLRSPMLNLKGFSAEMGDSLAQLRQLVHKSKSFLPAEVQAQVDELP